MRLRLGASRWCVRDQSGARHSTLEKFMRSLVKLVNQLKSDEDGASLVEYTVLLGILLVAVIATITFVGGWINNQWVALNAALPAT